MNVLAIDRRKLKKLIKRFIRCHLHIYNYEPVLTPLKYISYWVHFIKHNRYAKNILIDKCNIETIKIPFINMHNRYDYIYMNENELILLINRKYERLLEII